jgi:hypothetical protein
MNSLLFWVPEKGYPLIKMLLLLVPDFYQFFPITIGRFGVKEFTDFL